MVVPLWNWIYLAIPDEKVRRPQAAVAGGAGSNSGNQHGIGHRRRTCRDGQRWSALRAVPAGRRRADVPQHHHGQLDRGSPGVQPLRPGEVQQLAGETQGQHPGLGLRGPLGRTPRLDQNPCAGPQLGETAPLAYVVGRAILIAQRTRSPAAAPNRADRSSGQNSAESPEISSPVWREMIDRGALRVVVWPEVFDSRLE